MAHRNGGGFRLHSSSSSSSSSSVESAAKSLSVLSAEVTIHGSDAAQEWASRLSPLARRELSQLAAVEQQSLSGSGTTTTQLPIVVVPEPPPEELRRVALQQAIPFLGFGIMDNAILILAGDAIDTSLGVLLGISTMCAAAIGNIVSDVAGIMLGTLIEEWVAKLGLPIPQISAAQRQLRSVRFANQFGCAVGIVVGCIIGMFPLLLIDSNKISRLKQEAHMNSIFSDVVTKAKELVGAEFTNLYVIVEGKESTTPALMTQQRSNISKSSSSSSSSNKTVKENEEEPKQYYFYSKHGHSIHIPVGRGVVTRAAISGQVENLSNVASDPDFVRDLWKEVLPDIEFRSMVCVPVFDSRGQVIAILQAVNKVHKGIATRKTLYIPPPSSASGNNEHTPGACFTKTDESILKVLASHIAVSLQNLYEEDVEVTLTQTIDILREQGLAGLPDNNNALPRLATRPVAAAARRRDSPLAASLSSSSAAAATSSDDSADPAN